MPRYPSGYWNKKENQRKLLDSIATQLNIKKPSDWVHVTNPTIVELGGVAVLTKYGGSKYRMLSAVYPSIDCDNSI